MNNLIELTNKQRKQNTSLSKSNEETKLPAIILEYQIVKPVRYAQLQMATSQMIHEINLSDDKVATNITTTPFEEFDEIEFV